MKERKCALYLRVSTLRQADVLDGSLDAQEARLRSYVEFENNSKESAWIISGVYREEGRSGKDLKRPEFQQMMKDIKKGKINTVIISKIDRLTRSLKDFSALWDNFQKRGVEVISLNEKFDTTTAIGRAMLSIVLIFAQLEREQTGERTASTMQYRAEQGLWNGGRIVGYDLDPDNKGTLKVNPEQAKIVKKAFDLCLETGSAGQAQKNLNALGYRMPVYESRRGKTHGGTLFNKQSIINMLQNPVYLGKITWNGKVYDGNHKAIIDKKLFSHVQEILSENRKTRSNQKLPREHVYLLQGILRCGNCGSIMTPKSGIGRSTRYYYYQCTKNSHTGKEGCDVKYVPAEPIENFVVERIKELTTDETEIQKMIEKANKKGDKRNRTLMDHKENLEGHLQSIHKKLETIVDSIETGSLKAFDSINKRMKSLEAERDVTDEKLKAIDFEIAEIEKNRLSSEIMSQSYKSFRDIINKAKPAKLKELLYRIVEVVEWHQNKEDNSAGHCKISYFEQPNLKLPLKKQKLSEPNGNRFAESDVWLPSADSNHGQGG